MMVEELLNEETANEQGEYRVCIFTDLSRVKKLQARIVKTLDEKRYNKAKALQYLWDNSMALKCLMHSTTKEPV